MLMQNKARECLKRVFIIHLAEYHIQHIKTIHDDHIIYMSS